MRRFCARVFHSKQRRGDVYVAGALAELELGPSARNIAGARLAAERIVEGALSKRSV